MKQSNEKLEKDKIEIDQKYIDEAVRLAIAYPNRLKQKQFQEELKAGKILYTEDMAIADLTGGRINYGSEHVQSSNISNIPEQIAIKLSEGYVEKKNEQMVREATMSEGQLAELEENINIVQTAMRHMDRFDRAIFDRLFFKRMSYSRIAGSCKKGIDDHQICRAKKRALDVLAQEIMIREFYREEP